MAFTIKEKEFIDSAIGHLLEFSTEPNSFKAEVASLKTALASSVDSQHEFFHLRQCLINPNNYLQGLEKWGGTPHNLGEVRKFLSDYISEKVSAAAKVVAVNEQELEWNVDQLFLPFHLDDEKGFQSQQSVDSGEHPWQLVPARSPKIYRAILEPTSDKKVFARISIHTPLAWQEETYSPCLAEIPIMDSDEDENDFIYDLKEQARKVVTLTVADIVVFYLKAAKIIPESAKTNILTATLLTYKFYVLSLLSEKISWQQLQGLTKQQCQCLLNPTIMKLLDENRLLLDEVKQFTPEMVRLIATPFYYAKFVAQKISLKELQQVAEYSLLIYPPIIHLLQLEWMRISDVKTLSVYVKGLLNHPYYFDLMKKGKLSFSTAASLSQQECENLLDDNAVKLLGADRFHFDLIKTLSKEQLAILFLSSMQVYLENETFSLAEVIAIPYWKAKFIDDLPFLQLWIDKGVISLSEILESSTRQSVYGYVYGKRLLAIVSNKPMVVYSGIDNPSDIQREILGLAVDDLLNMKQACFDALRYLLVSLANEFKLKQHSWFFLQFNIEILTAKIRDGLEHDQHWQQVWETAIRAVFSLAEETTRRLQGQTPASITVFSMTDPFNAAGICKKLLGELRVFFDAALGVEKVVARGLELKV